MVGPRPLMWQRVIITCRGERGACVHVGLNTIFDNIMNMDDVAAFAETLG